jgi:hypothetical protein
MSARNRRPGIIARDGEPITQYGPEEFYAGCYARASVTPYANTQSKSLSLGLNHLQKLADGARLDACTSPENDFGADQAKYHAQQQTWTVRVEITTPQILSLAISIVPATVASPGQKNST